jgi:hypothetical protein
MSVWGLLVSVDFVPHSSPNPDCLTYALTINKMLATSCTQSIGATILSPSFLQGIMDCHKSPWAVSNRPRTSAQPLILF